MEKHEYARSVLEQARELLSERLVDSIVDSADGILNDAEGLSYMSEIDDVQERVLGRLVSVNQMISNFPPSSSDRGKPAGMELAAGSSTSEQLTLQDQPTLPDAATLADMLQKPQNFKLFVQQIEANDLNTATLTLSSLLGIDFDRSHQCAIAFRDQLAKDVTTLDKAILLRSKLQANEHNDCLTILWECFRLQGPQAVQALHTLQHQQSESAK